MSILEIISKSLSEAFWPRRFLPFFLLYFLLFVVASILLLPIYNFFPFTSLELIKYPSVVVNFFSLLAVFVIILLINLWFTGALIFDIKTKKGFELGLKYSKKIYLQMFALSLIIFVIASISVLAGIFGFIIQGIIDWVFILSLPAIVIKRDSFDIALMRSFSIVRKNILRSLSFWFLTRVIIFVLLFFLLYSIAFAFFGVTKISTLESLTEKTILASIFKNYLATIAASLVVSFFIAVSHVFNHISRAYFFLELLKRRY